MTLIYAWMNAAVSLAITSLLAWKLLTCHRQFSRLGRAGGAITAGASLMAGAAWAMPFSPFEGWSAVLLRIGILFIVFDWFHLFCCRPQGEEDKK